MINEQYLRALLRTVSLSTSRWSKRPSNKTLLNATAAALNVADREGLETAIEQLTATGHLGERRGRYLLTTQGEEADIGDLDDDQERRLVNYLAMAHRTPVDELPRADLETLYVVAAAEAAGRVVGSHTVAEVFRTSLSEAAGRLEALSEGGYLELDFPVPQIAVYRLTKAGRFELRRGDFRIDTIRYRSTRSERAQELIEDLNLVLDDE